MRKLPWVASVFVVGCTVAGCRRPVSQAPPPPPSTTMMATTQAAPVWTGIAETHKVGPYLAGPDVYVDLPGSSWPVEVEGKRVTITGVAAVRHDLPVFISKGKPGEADPAGMPMPPGTDLYKASERVVIEDARLLHADR